MARIDEGSPRLDPIPAASGSSAPAKASPAARGIVDDGWDEPVRARNRSAPLGGIDVIPRGPALLWRATHDLHLEVNAAEAAAILGLGGERADMYSFMLDEIGKMQQGQLTPAEYMTDAVRKAAELARSSTFTFPFEPQSMVNVAQGQTFSSLLHLAFYDPGASFSGGWQGLKIGVERVAAGLPEPAGSVLERAYQKLCNDPKQPWNGGSASDTRPGARAGFNPNVADSNATSPHDRRLSTVTHHFAEFLALADHVPGPLPREAVYKVDPRGTNDGDDRNGFFAVMIGSALNAGTITVDQAADLTVWAYAGTPGRGAPPWGSQAAPSFVDPSKYDVGTWLDAYRTAGLVAGGTGGRGRVS